jgi:hypothetical protein
MNLQRDSFLRHLAQCDVLAIQESWLVDEQAPALSLPPGWNIVTRSRAAKQSFSHAGGGIAIIYREVLGPIRILENVSGSEILAIEADRFCLISFYRAVDRSPYRGGLNTTPEERIEDAVAFCSALDKPMYFVGDANARTSQGTAGRTTTPRRDSSDTVSTDTAGRWLLGLCREHGLDILNGTVYEGSSAEAVYSHGHGSDKRRGAYTSFQPNGFSVIDYVMVNDSAKATIASNALVCIRDKSVSDHALLKLDVTLPPQLIQHLGESPPFAMPLPPDEKQDTRLDDLLDSTVAQKRSPQEACAALYGPSFRGWEDKPRLVWIACSVNKSRGIACAASYWGLDCPQNIALEVPGPPSAYRADLYALLYALLNTEADRPLRVYTSSFAICHSFAFTAGVDSEHDWPGAHADLRKRIAEVIALRVAPLELRHVSRADRLSTPHAAAHGLAKDAIRRGGLTPALSVALFVEQGVQPMLPAYDDKWMELYEKSSCAPRNIAKVSTSLRPTDKPPPPPRRKASSLDWERDDLDQQYDHPGHRGRSSLRNDQAENMSRLISAETPLEWWNTIQSFTDTKPRPSRVSVAELHSEFRDRINPPCVPPPHFDRDIISLRQTLSGTIPSKTIDFSPQKFFSRPIAESEIAAAKKKVKLRQSKSARGLDKVSYADIAAIPNTALAELFNTCMSSTNLPTNWLSTALVGILKQGKPSDEPSSYRLIGLESCLLKFLTLLVDGRIREWADSCSILPPSQNGFRTAYRTNNNSLILRCAIERANAQGACGIPACYYFTDQQKGKPLYVAFIDLKNAFPSVEIPILWWKLYKSGVSGPMFDWLRELYARMRYVVRHENELSAEFKSLLGLLTGDTASPVLWNIFFADIGEYIKEDPDDIVIRNLRMSHMEQADDVVLFSTTQAGLQRKLNQFFAWCRANAMTISTQKTQWMVFGPAPRSPWMKINDELIALTTSYKYVGITFSSTHNDMFTLHYDAKAKKASSCSTIVFTLHSFVGDVTPPLGYRLYMARTDPHLTFGCEVALDINTANRQKFEGIQHRFLRRLLGVHPRSLLAPLFTETGAIPIRYRRVLLALRALHFTCSLAADRLALLAILDSIALASENCPGWAHDLATVLAALPIPVTAEVSRLAEQDYVQTLIERVEESWKASLERDIHASDRLHLLHQRLVTIDGHPTFQVDKMQPYLRIPHARHRRALYRLLTSTHHLAVERQRYGERPFARRPRDLRRCRFCFTEIEDEEHAIFGCGYTPLKRLRNEFLLKAGRIRGELLVNGGLRHITEFSRLDDLTLLNCFAGFVYEVFCIFENAPMYYLPILQF